MNVSFENAPSLLNVTSVTKIKMKDESSDRMTYQVDSQGRLQDSSGNYLLNEDNQFVFVE